MVKDITAQIDWYLSESRVRVNINDLGDSWKAQARFAERRLLEIIN